MKYLISLLAIVFMSKECDKNKTPITTDSVNNIKENNVTQTQQPSGTYYVTFLKENNIKSLHLTLVFDENSKSVSGFSGCNHFAGTYTIKEDSIAFSQLITTKMACTKTPRIENLMLECLSKANSFSLEEDELTLKNGEENLLTAQKESIESVNNDMVLEYSTFSRGGTYKRILITNKTISVQKGRDSKMIPKPCSNEEWNNIVNLFKTINLKNLPTLKAPSQARLYDGADIADLKVIYKGATYDVPPFDHGNPAKEIEALVKDILSLSENIE
ncbi:MAG: hypothetical protein DRI75_01870 [Bacteroidetes bacterium]|nr:MAG: hypothetical protein DRI75_01870 [Bacteroidota bacterium]